MNYVVIQSLSLVCLFATPWTAACQASLSFTISWSLLKLMVIESVMPSNHLIMSPFSPPAFNLSQHQVFFPMSWLFPSDGESIGASTSSSVLPMNLQALQELNIQINYAIFKKIAASSEHLTNNLLHDLFLWDLTQMFPIFVKVKLPTLGIVEMGGNSWKGPCFPFMRRVLKNFGHVFKVNHIKQNLNGAKYTQKFFVFFFQLYSWLFFRLDIVSNNNI